MLFYTRLVLLSLATGVFSHSSVEEGIKEDINTKISRGLANLQSGMESLDNAFKNYKGGVPESLVSSSHALMSTMMRENDIAKDVPVLEAKEFLAVVPSIADLLQHIQTLVDHAKAKREVVKESNMCGVVRKQITGVQAKALVFMNTIASKVPLSGRVSASSLVSSIIAIIDDARTHYQSQSCTDA